MLRKLTCILSFFFVSCLAQEDVYVKEPLLFVWRTEESQSTGYLKSNNNRLDIWNRIISEKIFSDDKNSIFSSLLFQSNSVIFEIYHVYLQLLVLLHTKLDMHIYKEFHFFHFGLKASSWYVLLICTKTVRIEQEPNWLGDS